MMKEECPTFEEESLYQPFNFIVILKYIHHVIVIWQDERKGGLQLSRLKLMAFSNPRAAWVALLSSVVGLLTIKVKH